MTRWIKHGLLYNLQGRIRHPKLLTHAANPLAVHLTEDVYRIFYSGRDATNRSSVGAVDIDVVRRIVLHDHYEPVFQHGSEGSFYADGVSVGNCYSADGVAYMLFMGWQASNGVHWRGDIGRLLMRADLSLELESDVPFMGSTDADPISLSYPWVLQRDGDGYDMWYGSTISWDAGNNEMLHILKHARSLDGHHWERSESAVPYKLGQAQAFSRPTVARNPDGGYEMWFSYRGGDGKTYRIGHAQSVDAKNWHLHGDPSGIGVSEAGWDSEMVEYPFVFDHAGKRYMLYNGNGYGKTGFGIAVASND